eukprot:11177925-Alexandrium_andersonii.AAC.1
MGNRWTDNDLSRLWNFVATTPPHVVAYLRLLAGFLQDANRMRMSSKFFGWVSEVSHRKQGLRLLACVAQVATDPLSAEEPLHVCVVREPSERS